MIKDKVQEMLRIGGKALVLLNVPGGRTDQLQVAMGVPFSNLRVDQRDTVLQYIKSAKAGASGTVEGATVKLGKLAPSMASFSSRGPIPLANAVVMKPDVTAPGQ